MDSFCVACHVHFEDFEDDLWPACGLAAHFAQDTFVSAVKITVNFMHKSINLPQGRSTKTTETPLKGDISRVKYLFIKE